MGIYVNPGNESFSEDINSRIYVDKTRLLAELNSRIGTRDKFLCVSRPRRFGKTMAESMMAAYYSRGCDSRELFKGLMIVADPGFDKHLNKYNVLHLDINRFWSNYRNRTFDRMKRTVLQEFREEFADVAFDDDGDITDCIVAAYKATNVPFVVMLDEYDVIFRDSDALGLEAEYLGFLNSLFKGAGVISCIALAYITGILPVIRGKAQSKLNNFEEITFLRPGRFVDFTGFTEDEVQKLCRDHGMDFVECRRWYDGYRIRGKEIYAPKSVVQAMNDGEYLAYWNSTSTFKVIRDIILLNFDGMRDAVDRMISGDCVAVNISRFDNTPSRIESRDDAFTYLCHLGYLAYDGETQTCRIPDYEVRCEWVNAIYDNPQFSAVMSMINDSRKLLDSVWGMDADAVAEALERTHERLTSPLSYNNEQSFQSAIRLAFFYADSYYTVVSECPSGKGYADIAFIPYKPNIPAMVVELKVRGAADTALDQIRNKRYFAGLEKYAGSILLIGVSYDRKTKKHECVMERA